MHNDLTVAQAAKEIGVDHRTINSWIAEKIIHEYIVWKSYPDKEAKKKFLKALKSL